LPATLHFQRSHQYGAQGDDISIPIQLKVGERAVRIQAKVDTGATFCIFQREHGEELGIDIERGERKRITTAAGGFTAFGHEIILESFGWEFSSTVYFAEEMEFPRNVVGRLGWLHQFRIAIVDYEGVLHVSKYDD